MLYNLTRKGCCKMKKIEAIIRPETFQMLRDHLSVIGVGGMTVTEVAGTGKQKGKTGVFRGTTFEVQLISKLKLELVATEEQVEEIVDLILDVCSTDEIGDGKIFIYSVDDAIRIRTGERGKKAVL